MSAQILLSMIAPGLPPAPQGSTGGTAGEFEALLAGLAAGAVRGGEAVAAAPASPIEDAAATVSRGPALPVPSPLAPAAPDTVPAVVGETPDVAAPVEAEGDAATAPAEKAEPAAGDARVDSTDDTPADEATVDTAAPLPPAAPVDDAPPPAPAAVPAIASAVPAPAAPSTSSPAGTSVPSASPPQPLPAPVATPAAAATPPQGEPAAPPAAAPTAAAAAAPGVPSTPTPPATPVAVAVAAPPAASPPPPLRVLEGNAAASRDKRGSDASPTRQGSDPAERPTGESPSATATAKPTIDASPAPAYRPERSGEASPRLQPDAATSDEGQPAGATDAGSTTPQDGAPSVIREASTPAHLGSRTAIEATAQIAAQILRKLEGRSTRFEMALLPEELGRVDVKLDIDSEGRVAARLAFDNPAAAADLRGRADELRRQLEQAGFQLADDAFEFAERDSGSSAFDRGDDPRRGFGRAFTAATRLHAEADAVPAARWTSLSLTPAGVDLKV